MEHFEYEGNWWLPDNPSEAISGKLTFDPTRGCELVLRGKFVHDQPPHFTYDVILGGATDAPELSDDAPITAIDCRIVQWTTGRTDSTTGRRVGDSTRIAVGSIVRGIHFQKKEDIKFDGVVFSYLYQDIWLRKTGFKMSITKKGWRLSYRELRPINLNLSPNFKCQIFFRDDFVGIKSDDPSFIKIQQKSRFNIEYEQKVPLEQYKQHINDIQDFLCFCMARPTCLVDFHGWVREPTPYGTMIEIMVKLPVILDRPNFHNMGDAPLVMYSEMGRTMEKRMRIWMEHGESMRVIRQLYNSILQNQNVGHEQAFLNMCQALEIYHRVVGNNNIIPASQHQKRMDAIVRNIPNKHRPWVKRELAYSNNPKLRDRLNRILESHKEVFSTFIWNFSWFSQTTTITRNYLTHRGEKRKHVIAGDQLELRAIELRAILDVCMLSDMGFEDDEIIKLMATNMFHYDLILNKKHMPNPLIPLPGWTYPDTMEPNLLGDISPNPRSHRAD